MKPITAADTVEVSLEQRTQLVEAIWDSIAEIPEAVEIPAWHKQELAKNWLPIMQTLPRDLRGRLLKKEYRDITIQPYLTRRLIILSFRAAARNLERLLMRPKPRIPRVARNDKVR